MISFHLFSVQPVNSVVFNVSTCIQTLAANFCALFSDPAVCLKHLNISVDDRGENATKQFLINSGNISIKKKKS